MYVRINVHIIFFWHVMLETAVISRANTCILHVYGIYSVLATLAHGSVYACVHASMQRDKPEKFAVIYTMRACVETCVWVYKVAACK
jgi:hypothetical protein